MNVTYLHPRAKDLVGILPEFLSEYDPRRAAEQFNERYGWVPMDGWKFDPTSQGIKYPGDPVYLPVARIWLHKGKDRPEIIFIYKSAWVAIVQTNGSYEVARMN